MADAFVSAVADGGDRATATIALTLEPGVDFATVARASIEQVAACLGLPTGAIAAIDTRTFERYRGDAGLDDVADALVAKEFLAQQHARGLELQARAQRLLDRLYPGRALVTVSVELDNQWERLEERIQPDYPVLLTEERGSARDASAEGSGGTTTRRYEPFLGTRNRRPLAPDVRRISVALVLDRSIDSARHGAIESAIKAAVGFDDARDGGVSDRFDVLVEAFPAADAAKAGLQIDWWIVLPWVSAAGAVLALMLAIAFLRARAAAAARERARRIEREAAIAEVRPATPKERAHELRGEIERAIAADPASVSRLFEGWLAERRP